MKIFWAVLGLTWLLTSGVQAQLYGPSATVGSVGEYNETTGAVLNGALVASGQPESIAVSGSSLYVLTLGGPVAEYNSFTGATINASLIAGLSDPRDMVISGSNLYVTDHTAGTVGQYNASTGAPIHTALISGLGGANGIALSGTTLYVANATGAVIGEYNATTGAAINASLVTAVGTPRGLAVSGGNLYIANFSGNSIAKCNATTGAIINASFITGLNQPEYIAVAGSHLYVANQGNGTIGEYDLTTGAAINPSLVSGLVNPSAVAVVPPVVDVGNFNVQKTITYDQTGFTSPTLDPQNSYGFEASISPGSAGALLPYSSLAPPTGSTGSVLFQAGSNGLDFRSDYTSQAALDAGFADGTYNATIQTTTPNTYSFPLVLSGDNYPAVPQLTSVTNATWINGHLQITDITQPTTFTWTSFSSANGNINFLVNNTTISQSESALATNVNYTIPGNTLVNNTAFQGSLSFSNSNSGANPYNVSEGIQYQTQVNFDVWTGTPTPQASTVNVLEKDHALVQTSNSAPANGSGSNDDYAPAPYALHVSSDTSGTLTGPSGPLTVNFKASNDTGNSYAFLSAAIPDQETLDSEYPDGSYSLPDGNPVNLTGDVYPNAPQVTLVNGATPIWNAQGQLVLNPAIANTITWTAFSVTTAAFAAKGYEQAQFVSDAGDSLNQKQAAGIGQASTTLFNAMTIPANAMTVNHTYVGKLQYFLAPATPTSPSLNVYDAAGYQTENFFTAIAAASGASPQTINFAALNPQQVAGTNVTLVATATSGLPVSFGIVSGPASLSGNVLTFTATGTVTVQATQAGNSTYGAAAPVTQVFTVTSTASGGISQSINFPAIASPQNSATPLKLTATATSGLPVVYAVMAGPAVVNGNIISFTGAGTVTVEADQSGNGTYAAATSASQSFGVNLPNDLSYYQIQKSLNYVESSAAAPTLAPEGAYQFSCNVDSGSSGLILSSSTLIPPSPSTGTVAFQSSLSQLNFDQSFASKAAMDAAFATGSYQLTVQTSTPTTYAGTLVLGADNYPPTVPQITGLTNATWSGGNIVVTNPALPVNITFVAFNSAIGNIYFEVDGTSINLGFPANGSTTTATIPANSLSNNTLYHAAIGFQNTAGSTAIGGLSGAINYSCRMQFNVQVGTVTALPSVLNIAVKTHVLTQTSANAPTNGSGDKDGYDAAPYSLAIESPTAGSSTGPTSINYPLVYDNFGGSDSNGNYRYFSGEIGSQAAMDSTYPDGNYRLADGNTASLTGDNYPNTPQLITVNGLPPIWNSSGQLVLDPGITNTLAWTSFSVAAGTFASNGHETAEIQSNADDSVDIQQKAGVTETSNVAFNTATVLAGTLTSSCTYVGSVEYFLASSVTNPVGNVYDAAGYQTETFFTILAQPLPTALNPTFSSATDVGVTTPSYIATGINLVLNLNFAPTSATTLTVINNTGSGAITGTFNNVTEGGTINATFGGTTYTFTATYKGGDGNDMTLTYTKPLPPSSLTILHSFGDASVPNDGMQPEGLLTQSPDGNFYSTSAAGGASNFGTVYKITSQGQVTILHSFNGGTDGSNPRSLVLGTDGNFYGLTQLGGTANAGTIFKITPQGQFTTLHTFGDGSVPNDGAGPEDVLIQGSDGNFYSSTSGGGSAGQGTVFKVTPQGQVTIIHSFADGSVINDGSSPASYLLQASDGNFYGTTNAGGSANEGTVFKITSQGQVTILHSFGDGSVANDGADPFEGLVQASDGCFYSVTLAGGNAAGPNGNGTVFKITPQGQLTILHRFNDGSIPNDGAFPIGRLLIGKDGNFYGGTRNGGNTQIQVAGQDFPGAGVLFRITPQGVLSILHVFEDGTVLNDGALSTVALSQTSDGTLYGATLGGGSANGGAVFKLTTDLPVITSGLTANGAVGLAFNYQITATNVPTSYSAMGLPGGLSINPATGLITGTPTAPGTYSAVLTLSNAKGPSSAPLTITVTPLPPPTVTSILTAYGTLGQSFSYRIVGTNNPLSYSATGLSAGQTVALPNGLSLNATTGVISGTPTVSGTFSITLSATNASGSGATSALVLTLFASPPAPSQEYNVLYPFTQSGDAVEPSVLFQGFDGSFYGISTGGGQNFAGTIFNITNQGTETVVHSFGNGNNASAGGPNADGLVPQGLLQAADGSFYGTTLFGGLVNKGTVFKIAPDGTETILHSFGDGSVVNDGAAPLSSGLTQGADGNFYGVTQAGGSAGLGTVFEITPLGTVTILHSFGDNTIASDGASPEANLLQGDDGNFYGTTEAGGSHSAGTVFEITRAGTVTILHSFQGGSVVNDGANPVASLIQSPAGIFYGTTKNGGSHGVGTIFQMTSDGTVTILHHFGDGTVTNDGATPESPVILGDDGNYYGMTNKGGAYNEGTIFAMSPTNGVTLVHQFGDPSVANDGTFPTSALYEDASGNFYGTTSTGSGGPGTVFSIVTTQAPTHVPVFTGATSLSAAAQTPFSFTPKAYFGVSTDTPGGAVQSSIVSQVIRQATSQTTNWTLAGTLPQFLVFDSTSGTISGSAIQPGTYTFTLTPNNASGTGIPQTITLYIAVAPTISSATSASGIVQSAFTYSVTATARPTSYGATGLPGWLAVNTSTGVISGTPPGAGTFSFSPTASNIFGSGTEQVTVQVASGSSSAPVLTGATTASATVGNSFTYQIAATNAPTSYSALTLPQGLIFNSGTGLISGIPASTGTFNLPISATNASGTTSGVLTLAINPVVAPVITSCSSLTCSPSSVISYRITGTNSPTIFGATGLPTGLSLNPNTGIITGTPATTGDSTVALSATNSIGTGTSVLALIVQQGAAAPALTSPSTGGGAATLPFTYQVTGTNNPTNFSATGLPSGVTIDSVTGIISGSSTVAGIFNITVYITGSTLGTGTSSLTLTFTNPTFSQWAALYPGVTSATATPYHDGIPNGLKFLFDINPTGPMTAADRVALPALGSVVTGGTEYLTLTFREYSLANLQVQLQTSADMQTWTTQINPDLIEQVGTDSTTGDPIMMVGAKTTGTKQFIRLNVVAP
jgi:uncharacterized repeat protein (TIGR03803 family)